MNDILELECFINNNTFFEQEDTEELDYYSSEGGKSPFNIQSNPIIQENTKTITATSIIRTYFSNKIIESLDWLVKNHKLTIESLPYIQELFENLHKYKEQYFEDPFSSFLSALYDGLIFENKWIEIDREMYEKIANIINSLNNKRNLNYEHVDKSINELEKMGIDTTPY